MQFSKFTKHFQLILITVLSTLFFWSIFYTNLPQKLGFGPTSLETVFANYDGPNYLVITKCGYVKDCIGQNFSLPLPLEYYPAHLPGYPAIIRFFEAFTTGPKAMLFSTLLGSIFLTLVTFKLFSLYFKEKAAFWLSVLFIFFPARFFILRQIGAPETWFLATTITSILLFKNKKFLLAALLAAIAQSIKSPGIILFAAYMIVALHELVTTKKFIPVLKKYFAFLLVPITILTIFYIYFLQTGDWFAYFHSGDNFHLNYLPFLVFISTKTWIDSIWLEDIIYIYLIAVYGIYRLFKKFKFDIITVYPALFTLAALLVAHRDISRYIAPVYPFLILAFGKFLVKKPVKIIFLILIPAIYLYAINFVAGNTAPIADWTPYL